MTGEAVKAVRPGLEPSRPLSSDMLTHSEAVEQDNPHPSALQTGTAQSPVARPWFRRYLYWPKQGGSWVAGLPVLLTASSASTEEHTDADGL